MDSPVRARISEACEVTDTTGGGELVVCCGGSNQHTMPEAHRIQSDDVTWPDEPPSEIGFRLVWERR